MIWDLSLLAVLVGMLRLFVRNDRHRHMFQFGSFPVLDGLSWIFSGSSPFSAIDPALIQ